MLPLELENPHSSKAGSKAGSETNAGPVTVSDDEAEALEILRRNQEDEALAMKLQRMMDAEGAKREEDRDLEIARRFQVWHSSDSILQADLSSLLLISVL